MHNMQKLRERARSVSNGRADAYDGAEEEVVNVCV